MKTEEEISKRKETVSTLLNNQKNLYQKITGQSIDMGKDFEDFMITNFINMEEWNKKDD